jgi:hypothetical protein
MVRKIIRALVLIPLAIVLVTLAVANRQTVLVSFDPFDPSDPALTAAVPLYALILSLVIVGVVVGGVAAWLRQGKWRGRARMAESQARELKAENDLLKHRAAAATLTTPALPSTHAPRLSIPPPAG